MRMMCYNETLMIASNKKNVHRTTVANFFNVLNEFGDLLTLRRWLGR